MGHYLKLLVIAGAMLWCGSAKAAVDWCRLLNLLPASGLTFNQIAAGIDQLGCEARPQNSAHDRAWRCTDREAGDTFLLLMHLVPDRGYAASEPNLLMIGNATMSNLDRFRLCGLTSRHTSDSSGTFDPASIAVQDRLTIERRYLTTPLTLLRISGSGIAVAGYPESFEGTSIVPFAEQALFGISRPSYPFTSVEIAGANLIRSRAADVVAALESRGARVTERDDDQIVRRTVLTPPVGLDGVTEVEITAFNQHVWHVEYEISDLAAYMTYVGLLDERYGRSSVRNGTVEGRRDCRDRWWDSGNVTIMGSYCPSSGYRLWFTNVIVSDQRDAYVAHLDAPANSQERRRIDPDNL